MKTVIRRFMSLRAYAICQALALIVALSIPERVFAAETPTSTDLSYSGAASASQSADGVSIFKQGAQIAIYVCGLITLVLGGIAVVGYMDTHEFSKIRKSFLGFVFFFVVTGLFFYFSGYDGSTASTVLNK